MKSFVNLLFCRDYRYLIIVFLAAALNLMAVLFIFGWQTDEDTGSYAELINYFSGEPYADFPVFRMIKPFAIFFAVIFTPFFHAEKALIFENILFYFGAVILIFKIADLLFQNKKQAFISAAFFMTAYSVLRWGLAALTDMSGWFFYLLSVYLALVYLKKKDEKLLWLNGFLSGIGVLFKETGGMGMLFLIPAVLVLADLPLREKIRGLLKGLAIFILTIVMVEVFIFWHYRYSFIDWFIFAQQIKPVFSLNKTMMYLAQNAFALMFLGWFFVIRGAWLELKSKNRERLKIFGLLLIPSLSFFVWPFSWLVRLMFISGLLLCLLAGRGAMFAGKRSQIFGYAGMALAVIFNFVFPKFIDLAALQDFFDNYLRLI